MKFLYLQVGLPLEICCKGIVPFMLSADAAAEINWIRVTLEGRLLYSWWSTNLQVARRNELIYKQQEKTFYHASHNEIPIIFQNSNIKICEVDMVNCSLTMTFTAEVTDSRECRIGSSSPLVPV